MNAKTKIDKGDNADVKSKVIDFSTVSTESREDDNEKWNAMRFYGEDDRKEAEYESPSKISAEAKRNISDAKAKFIGVRMMEIFNMKVA